MWVSSLGPASQSPGNDVDLRRHRRSVRVERLNRGEVPIYEPGLDVLIERNLAQKQALVLYRRGRCRSRRLHVIFIAVGTPPGTRTAQPICSMCSPSRGPLDRRCSDEKIVITKSTVPVGYRATRVREAIEAETDIPVHVCSNPEFLKEGAAVDDFMKPDRVVIGVDSEYVLLKFYVNSMPPSSGRDRASAA